MIEVEQKYRSPGNEKVEKALAKLEAKKVSDESLEDVYFTHPCRDFGKTDESLRLRKKESGAELSYKGQRMHAGSSKAREEVTLRTDDPLALQRIVERLGFKDAYVLRKRRVSYLLDKLRVDVDEVEGLGEFVELEVLTESTERATQLIELARKELGLERLEPRTYLEIHIAMQKEEKKE